MNLSKKHPIFVKRSMYVHFVHILLWITLLGFVASLSGCTAMVIAAGEKAYNHVRGDLLGIVPEKLDKVYTASLEATKHLDNYQVTDNKLTAINGKITTLGNNSKKMTIELTKTENDQTQIQIRIGAFGNKIESVYIYDCIQRQLRNPSPKLALAPF